MIESIIATSLVIVGILGIMSLIVNSSHRSASATNKLVAAYLAAEDIEVVKNMLDASYVQNTAFSDALPVGQFAVNYNSAAPHSVTNQSQMQVWHNITPPNFFSQKTIPLDPGVRDNQTIFSRYILIGAPDSHTYEVQSVVIWKDNGVTASTTLVDQFTSWRY